MRRGFRLPIALALALVAAIASAHAGTYSKTFLFKPGVDLEVGEDLGDGLRLDSLRFDVAGESWGTLRAVATVSNLGKAAKMFSVAVAVLDDGGRLLAAGNGGPKLFPLRAGRQGPFKVSLTGFGDGPAAATQFKIAIHVSD